MSEKILKQIVDGGREGNMGQRSIALITGLWLVCAVLAPVASASAATTTPVSTLTFTLAAPISEGTNPFASVIANYTNTSNSPVFAIVYLVLHNSQGQTVFYSVATIQLNAGQTAPAFLVISLAPRGTYSGTVFAVQVGGAPVSVSTTAQITV